MLNVLCCHHSLSPCSALTLSLPAVAPYGGGGDRRDGDAVDGGRHLHLQHLAPPRLLGSVVWQRVLHGVPQLEARHAVRQLMTQEAGRLARLNIRYEPHLVAAQVLKIAERRSQFVQERRESYQERLGVEFQLSSVQNVLQSFPSHLPLSIVAKNQSAS